MFELFASLDDVDDDDDDGDDDEDGYDDDDDDDDTHSTNGSTTTQQLPPDASDLVGAFRRSAMLTTACWLIHVMVLRLTLQGKCVIAGVRSIDGQLISEAILRSECAVIYLPQPVRGQVVVLRVKVLVSLIRRISPAGVKFAW